MYTKFALALLLTMGLAGCSSASTESPAAADEDAATDAELPDGGSDELAPPDAPSESAQEGDASDGAADDAEVDSGADDAEAGLGCTADHRWWIWDLSVMPPANKQICATERGAGQHVHVIVADDDWGGKVTQSDVDKLIPAWDSATPAQPSLGTFAVDTGLFGDPPDIDNDPRVFLLVYQMGSFGGTSFDGYFRDTDQTNDPTSNHHEMLHLNSANFNVAGDYMLGVQAHEFQHLIHYHYDPGEEIWLNESLSEVAMIATGWDDDAAWVNDWLGQTQHQVLMPSNPEQGNYGIDLLFGTYLWERFGDSFIRGLVADPLNGVASIDHQLQVAGSSETFPTVLGDFGLAVAVNDTAVSGGIYGYEKITFAEPHANALTAGTASTVSVPGRGGLVMLKCSADFSGKTLHLDAAALASLELRAAVKTGIATTVVPIAQGNGPIDIDLSGFAAGPADLWVVLANAGAAQVAGVNVDVQ